MGCASGLLLLADGVAAGLAKVVGFVDVELDVALGRGSALGFVCGGGEVAVAHLDLMPVLAVPSAAFEVPSPGGALGAGFVPREAAVFALCHGVEAMMLSLRHARLFLVFRGLRFEICVCLGNSDHLASDEASNNIG